MITFDSVCQKLGFDFTKDCFTEEEMKNVHESDGLDSPYLKLSAEECEFILNYLENNGFI